MTESPEDIPQVNSLLYVVHLNSGEELLCTLLDENETGIVIESPVTVKAIPMLDGAGNLVNELSSASWMPFAATRIFSLKYTDILIYTEMHPIAHALYVRLVNRFELVDSTGLDVKPSPSSFLVTSGNIIH